jgi:Domain of unknown function (DUF4440)
MKPIRTALLLPMLVVSLVAPAGQGRAQTNDTTAEITKFEARFSSALARNAVDELGRYLSADWKIISGDGSIIDRTRFLGVIASGDLKHTKMSSENLTILLYGNTALVTSHAQSAGSYKGSDFETNEIGTDVIVKTEGHWVCVLTQLTTIAQH